MKLLALDTSSLAASCAIWAGGRLAGEYFINAGLTHSQTVMPMVEALLQTTGIPIDEISGFAVSAGPGSFTGLRIGMAAVKGMAAGTGKPCFPVSTLMGLAQNVVFAPGYIAPVMDARRSQVYTALFFSNGQALSRVQPDEAVPIEALRARFAALDAPVALVGDGAALCIEALGQSLPALRLCPEGLRHQRASSIAQLAKEGSAVSAEELAPVYLRLPQAERERLEKEKKHNS